MSTNRLTVRRAAVPVVTAGLLLLATAGAASAHVTAHSPDPLTQGGYAEIVFRAPDEQPAATFGKLEIDFPKNTPIGAADVKPLPGWSYQVNMVHLATPVKMAKETITDAVGSIVWTAQPGSEVKPGEFQEFTVSAEGLPTNTTNLVMPAVQTYGNGVVVDWNQVQAPGQAEPEHPAPHHILGPAGATAAAPTGSTGDTAAPAAPADDRTALWLGGIGVLLGGLALGLALGALLRSRRGPKPPITDEVDTDDVDEPTGASV
jgi:periplasmic copper chaperone A